MIEKFKLKKLSYAVINELTDIDVVEDLKNWFDKNKLNKNNPLIKFLLNGKINITNQ